MSTNILWYKDICCKYYYIFRLIYQTNWVNATLIVYILQYIIFNLIINNTAETEWMKNSHKNSNYITITEQELDSLLKGNIPNQYTKKINELTFRF